jgi:uncharacterized RDD family membrane protein YckC
VADAGVGQGSVAATLGQRFGGRLVDTLVLMAVVLPLLFVLDRFAYRLVAAAVSGTYEIVAIAVWGQTFGKRVAGTRVVSTLSGPLSLGQAVVRFLVYSGVGVVLSIIHPLLSTLWFVVIVVSILRDREHRGVHDLAARTIVVSAPASIRRADPMGT